MTRAVTKPSQRAATYEDLLAVPEPLVAEMLFGELVTHPRPFTDFGFSLNLLWSLDPLPAAPKQRRAAPRRKAKRK